MLHGARRIGQQRRLQFRPARNRLLREDGWRLPLEPLDGETAQHVDKELLLGGVVVIKGLLGDPCLTSDGVHRGALISPFEEKALGGGAYLLAFGAYARRLPGRLRIP